MSNRIELVAIDLDGTLVDSVADLHAAVVQMQGELQLPVSTELEVRGWVGNGIERLVHRSLTRQMDGDADEHLFNSAVGLFRNAYQVLNGTRSVLYPGVQEGLDWLRLQGMPLVVVTNKAGLFARPLLEKLAIDQYFSMCVAGDDVSIGKPHPEGLLLAAEHCDAKPRSSLLIGDSVADIKSARAAGFGSVCVSYGYNHGQAVTDLQGELRPDEIIDSFQELPAVFDRIS